MPASQLWISMLAALAVSGKTCQGVTGNRQPPRKASTKHLASANWSLPSLCVVVSVSEVESAAAGPELFPEDCSEAFQVHAAPRS